MSIRDWFRRKPRAIQAETKSALLDREYEVKSTSDVVEGYSSDPAWAFSFNAGTSPMASIESMAAVFACARRVVEAACRVELKVFVGDEAAPSDHPLAELLRRPVPGMGRSTFVQHLGYGALLTGGAYIEKKRSSAMPESAAHLGRAQPHQLWPYFEGQIISTMMGPGVPLVSHYTKTVTGKQETLQTRDVARIVLVRPGEFGRGLSPVEVGAREISIDRAAAEWQQCTMQNRGVPDGLLVADRPLSPTQYADTEKRIKEKWSGVVNAHLPILMGNSMKWQDLAKSMLDLEFLQGRKWTRGQICMLFGVSEVLFELAGTTYSNLETAELSLWVNAALPLVEAIVEVINTDIASEYDPDVTVHADTAKIAALVAVMRERWKAAEPALKSGVPMSQVSNLFGLGVTPYPGWDVPIVPQNLVTLSSVTGVS